MIPTPRGSLHLVLVLGRRAPGPLPLSEVQDLIEAGLKEKVWKQRLQTWITKTRSEAHIEIYLR